MIYKVRKNTLAEKLPGYLYRKSTQQLMRTGRPMKHSNHRVTVCDTVTVASFTASSG